MPIKFPHSDGPTLGDLIKLHNRAQVIRDGIALISLAQMLLVFVEHPKEIQDRYFAGLIDATLELGEVNAAILEIIT